MKTLQEAIQVFVVPEGEDAREHVKCLRDKYSGLHDETLKSETFRNLVEAAAQTQSQLEMEALSLGLGGDIGDMDKAAVVMQKAQFLLLRSIYINGIIVGLEMAGVKYDADADANSPEIIEFDLDKLLTLKDPRPEGVGKVPHENES